MTCWLLSGDNNSEYRTGYNFILLQTDLLPERN